MTRNDENQEPASETFEKKTGVAHLFAAGQYSMQGFRRLVQESAFRHELLALGAGLVLFAIVGASLVEFLGFVVLMAILFSIEALNTAIEELVDRISPEISTVGRNAKDLGSFAVFCLLVANGLYVTYVVIFRAFID
ncbi:diacylglycerol kinase [Rhizobium sp. S95]|uniref:Diacylglycerol kinase n=1 Tax=Ciceribacter sichuanensis TaxID=2949647 RepID=A0AAJ1BUH5_9HYPH|nr:MULTISPECIES: diacylglycerol kinase [unclassified Ciceribacter]MCM2399187.1 diacylglycerol kinase [Ciceribacter sp. S95]MCO5956607.1 diacylglycerol kinase [Ciceribacter sp. S101]